MAKVKKGKRMSKKGGAYTLITSSGRRFKGTLIKTFNLGRKRLAIFSVPKRTST